MTENKWIVLQTGKTFEAHWVGPNKRPIGAFGECVGVFNTTFDKAQDCVDIFNHYLRLGEDKKVKGN